MKSVFNICARLILACCSQINYLKIVDFRSRRTFCIVSHPDAGKTTLTEKLLLFGGAIHEAGTVKARKAARHATSDWMEIEKQRGISVTSSVLQFDYRSKRINLLDTPGHHDFSEDTFRVITAVDSALMVVDAAKGVEEQTKKLMKICSERQIPVMSFVNKMDRESRSPIDLLDEIEATLGVQAMPMTWPIGSGQSFQGVYHLDKKNFYPFVEEDEPAKIVPMEGIEDPKWAELVPEDLLEVFREQVQLALGIYGEKDQKAYLSGAKTPVYFGSALRNFGVQILLDDFVDLAPEPQIRKALEREVHPNEEKFSGFIFKIQANMDARHRDRVAFLRVCSGKFKKGMEVFHPRRNKKVRISNTFQFLASKRESVEEACAGDIVGLYDTGDFKIGDTLTEKENLSYLGIPNFAPEMFKKVILTTPLKSKQLRKGLQQLCEEGASQVFFPTNSNDIVVGVVGQLQFEVIRHRLDAEYGAGAKFESCAFTMARWVLQARANDQEFEQALDQLRTSYDTLLSVDNEERLAILVSSSYALNKARERFPLLEFSDTSEMVSRTKLA